MEHGIHAVDDFFAVVRIQNIAAHDLHIQMVDVAGIFVRQGADAEFNAFGTQLLDNVRTDKAGAAGDECFFHGDPFVVAVLAIPVE